MNNRNVFSIQLLKLLPLMVTAFLFTACGDSSSSSSTNTSFDEVYTKVFVAGGCGGASCHSSGTDASDLTGGPDMSSKSAVYSNLVGKTVGSYDWTISSKADCSSATLIKAGSVAQSAIIGIFDETFAASFIDTVSGCTPGYSYHRDQQVEISSAALTLLKDWITSGAPQT